MPKNHPLTPKQWQLLIRLADPEAPCPTPSEIGGADMSTILRAAQDHVISPIVCRKLVSNPAVHSVLGAETKTLMDSLQKDHLQCIGLTMLLEHHAKKLQSIFSENNIRAEMVKGLTFSSKLYPHKEDRIYTDIDFLVHLEDLERANQIAQESGLSWVSKSLDTARETLEYAWVIKTNTINLLLELHGDLIHSENKRQFFSYGYQQHMLSDSYGAAEAVKFLLVGVIHNAFGTKFSNLKVMIDVLQACRKISPSDYPKLIAVVKALGATLEIGVTTQLVANIFQDQKAGQIAQLFKEQRGVGLANRLMTSKAVYQINSPNRPIPGIVKEHAFRLVQKTKWMR